MHLKHRGEALNFLPLYSLTLFWCSDHSELFLRLGWMELQPPNAALDHDSFVASLCFLSAQELALCCQPVCRAWRALGAEARALRAAAVKAAWLRGPLLAARLPCAALSAHFQLRNSMAVHRIATAAGGGGGGGSGGAEEFVYFVGGEAVRRLRLGAAELPPELVYPLTFPVDCLAVGCGFLALGGEQGRGVLLRLDEDEAEDDEVLFDGYFGEAITNHVYVAAALRPAAAVAAVAPAAPPPALQPTLIVCSNDGMVRAWSLPGMRPAWAMPFPPHPNCAALSPDRWRRFLVGVGDDAVILYELERFAEGGDLAGPPVTAAAAAAAAGAPTAAAGAEAAGAAATQEQQQEEQQQEEEQAAVEPERPFGAPPTGADDGEGRWYGVQAHRVHSAMYPGSAWLELGAGAGFRRSPYREKCRFERRGGGGGGDDGMGGIGGGGAGSAEEQQEQQQQQQQQQEEEQQEQVEEVCGYVVEWSPDGDFFAVSAHGAANVYHVSASAALGEPVATIRLPATGDRAAEREADYRRFVQQLGLGDGVDAWDASAVTMAAVLWRRGKARLRSLPYGTVRFTREPALLLVAMGRWLAVSDPCNWDDTRFVDLCAVLDELGAHGHEAAAAAAETGARGGARAAGGDEGAGGGGGGGDAACQLVGVTRLALPPPPPLEAEEKGGGAPGRVGAAETAALCSGGVDRTPTEEEAGGGDGQASAWRQFGGTNGTGATGLAATAAASSVTVGFLRGIGLLRCKYW
jgi:hypothetical protein